MDKEQLLEDERLEWWKASARDKYDINEKLLRVGCRPLKRKLILCKKEQREKDHAFSCMDMEEELKTCIRLLQYVQSTYVQKS
ncbi:unnamed protein product [Blepharisma stoltei]|uniref:Uncharacterized protein n=1 Tax=Blepharisma stoltei TaxID=1481888 RepID=A0AAU9IZG0_9CILI|nr:unnamed protein product [Blepharisma stoltei]